MLFDGKIKFFVFAIDVKMDIDLRVVGLSYLRRM